jgi:SHS2 domain-containing protein
VYRWLDHTAELELEIEAASEHKVLSAALDALRELLEGNEAPVSSESWRGHRDEIERRAVRATASDRPALLAAWLEELVFLAESEGFIPIAIERLSLEDGALGAIVAGHVGEARPLVKAVTYHRLQFEPSERGYRARVVFDV